ncbi:MAG TPA: hypothetical protein VEY51_01240 [Chondromyces sp.]|nr:hypothetical protein [Chondromyces sp.]
MAQKVAIGFDHGNGYVKGKSDLVDRYIIPSAVAYEEKVPRFLNGELEVDEYYLRKGTSGLEQDTVYVFGDDVFEISDYMPTMGHQDRIKNDKYKVLSDIVLAELAGDEEAISSVIVTGVPSNQIGTRYEDELKKFLKSTHIATVEDQNIVVQVSDVIVIPQPVGTVMYLYLDEEGYIQNSAYETDSVCVIDIGKGTTDIDHIKGLKRTEDYHSIGKGMYDVYTRIAKAINKEHPNANANAESVEKFFEHAKFEVSKRHIVPFEKEKQKAIQEVADELITEITRSLKSWDRFDEIVLTGGGAEVFEEYIRKVMPDIEVIEDAQFSNTEGFYRYAKYIKEVKYGDTESVSVEV